MSSSRLLARFLARFLALVTAAAVLLVVPVTTATAGAVPARSVVGVDSDGDGLDDSVDGCPSVASANPTGCPSASRSVSLRWLAGKQRLQVRVTSPVRGCASRARVALWRVRSRKDDKVLGDTVSFSGRLRAKVARGATYYVTVSLSYRAGVAECGQATSRRVAVPRS